MASAKAVANLEPDYAEDEPKKKATLKKGKIVMIQGEARNRYDSGTRVCVKADDGTILEIEGADRIEIERPMDEFASGHRMHYVPLPWLDITLHVTQATFIRETPDGNFVDVEAEEIPDDQVTIEPPKAGLPSPRKELTDGR